MNVPIYKGRKVNKVLCLSFLLVTMILFMTAGIFAFLKKSAVCDTFCILALISGAFSLLYGTLWLIYGLKEKKTERELSEFFGRQNMPVDPARPDYREFFLPEERLKGMSRKRFRSVLRWTGFAALAAFLLICGIQLAVGSLASPLQVLFIFLFCALITIPGILVQLYLFLKYDCSVPSRILLFPGKLIIDDTVFLAGEILEIRISPDRIMNFNSPAVFREMLIRKGKRSIKYRFDYRAGRSSADQPFWEEYEQFVAALSAWGAENTVPVIISYMA